jgi:hypothetical protein
MIMNKSQKLATLILGLAGAIASAPASADPLLYSNGPATAGDYTSGAYFFSYISEADALTNSFTLSQNSTLTGADFSIIITDPQDSLLFVNYEITTAPFGGTIVAEAGVYPDGDFLGCINISFQGDCWDTYEESFSIPSLSLSAGTYWLEFYDTGTAHGGLVALVDNNGPSVAWTDFSGTEVNLDTLAKYGISNSDAFDVYGTTEPVVPEPSSLLLLGSGLAAFAGMARYKFRTKAH